MMTAVAPAAVAALAVVPPAAERAGAELRAARERLGLALHDVALNLRIRLPHLEALEEGRISLLPGNAYALAFVRTYAGAIGLDAEEMVRRFRTEATEFSRRTELVFPAPMPERGLPAGAAMLLGLVLVIGAYAGWYRLSGDGRLPAEAVTAIPERLAPLAEQALPPVAAVVADAAATPPPRILSQDRAEPEPVASRTPPAMAISPSSAAAAQIDRPPVEEPAVPVIASPTVPAADATRIILHASADAWVSVKDRTGAVLMNRTLKSGETWAVPPRTDLLLTTGNAGGTDLVVDGATTASLGAAGAVRRDLPLDPDRIKDGKLAATAMPQLASSRPHQ